MTDTRAVLLHSHTNHKHILQHDHDHDHDYDQYECLLYNPPIAALHTSHARDYPSQAIIGLRQHGISSLLFYISPHAVRLELLLEGGGPCRHGDHAGRP